MTTGPGSGRGLCHWVICPKKPTPLFVALERRRIKRGGPIRKVRGLGSFSHLHVFVSMCHCEISLAVYGDMLLAAGERHTKKVHGSPNQLGQFEKRETVAEDGQRSRRVSPYHGQRACPSQTWKPARENALNAVTFDGMGYTRPPGPASGKQTKGEVLY